MRKESDSRIFTCVICKEEKEFYSMGQCEHRGVCDYCSMKSRMLYKDLRCPICTTRLDFVFILDKEDKTPFVELVKEKDLFYVDDDFKQSGIYYTTISAQEQALKLKNFVCPIKSCQESSFDNLQMLINHLNKIHKRFYCETCLKEGKKFLSEMPIYNHLFLNEHISFGEFSNSGSLVVPPHPSCPFCQTRFYNDEQLFKHMNELHFNCQLCKDKKNIIFYSELSNLLDHYKSWHHVCPYQECLDNIFVVFETEEKLNAHLITKHKCSDTKSKMTKFLFSDNSNQTTSGALGKKDNSNAKKNEFNFTNYINQLKESSKVYGENYVKNLSKKIEAANRNQYREYNAKQDFDNLGYYDSRNQDRQYTGDNYKSNKQFDKWGYQGKQGGKNSNVYNNINNSTYNNNYNFAQQAAPPQKPKSNNPNDIFDYFVKQESYSNPNTYNQNINTEIEVVYTYENENRDAGGKGKRGKRGRGGNVVASSGTDYGNFYEKQQYEEINTVGLPPQKGKKGKKNKRGKYDYVEQEIESNSNNHIPNQTYELNQDQTQFNDSSNNRVNINSYDSAVQFNGPSSSSSNILTMDPNVDYKFVLKSWVLGIREYLKEKIQRETLAENDFILPAETIYQMIVIIDRLEKQKILELQSIINFGFDLDIVKEVRVLLLSGFYDKESIKHVLDRLDIKKILLLYKYLHISSNKLNGLYYKLDYDMIDPDLYEDFVKRERIKKKNFNENRINTGFNYNNVISLDSLNTGGKASDSALGKLTKKMEGFSFKDEKNKKNLSNIPSFGPDSNIKIVTKPKNNKLKTLLSGEEIPLVKEDKPEKKQMNLIDLVPRNVETELNIPISKTTSNLKLLMEGKHVEPKKPEPAKSNVLKKKFKVDPNDLPSI